MKSLGILGVVQLIFQIVLLGITIYEIIKSSKFLAEARGTKKRGALIYLYIMGMFTLALWAALSIIERDASECYILILAYMMFYFIPREVKTRVIN